MLSLGIMPGSCCYMPLVDCGPEISLMQMANDTIVIQKGVFVEMKAYKYEVRRPPDGSFTLSMQISFEQDFQKYKIEYDTSETYILINQKKINPSSFMSFPVSEGQKETKLSIQFSNLSTMEIISPGIEFYVNNIHLVSNSDTTTFGLTNLIVND
jgi:hypothetical protein